MTDSSSYDGVRLGRQTVLITGGATGLGFGIARCFHAAGATVLLVGRRRSMLAGACAEIGPNVHALEGDVADLDWIEDLVERAEKVAGPITTLVNNAGVHLRRAAFDTTDSEFASVHATHVDGAFALSRAFGKRMSKMGGGSVLFITSMTALAGMPQMAAYSAAKSAQFGLIRTLASEWGPLRIRVNGIAPGWICSPMLTQALAGEPIREAKILERIALGSFGRPEDIGQAAVFLSSPAAAYITGVVLPIDGGASVSL